MKIWVKFIFIGILFIALLSACGGNSSPSSEIDEIINEEVILKNLPSEVQELIAEEEFLPDFPLISHLDASPKVVSPGEEVTISGATNLYGSVRIDHASISETFEFSSGSGSFVMPADAPDGVYAMSLENEEGAIAFGSFRVASAPGIWLSTNGNYVSVDEYVEIRVTTHQLPQDMLAIFLLGDLAQDPFSEDDYINDVGDFDPFAFDGPSAYLLPNREGVLQVGMFPGVSLEELTGRTFLLPGRLANQIQVYALDTDLAQLMAEGFYTEDDSGEEDYMLPGREWASNIVSIQQCNLVSEIKGDLGDSGIVRAVSLDGEVVTQTYYSEDGRFSMQIPPGTTIIESWQETEEGITYFPSQTVDVSCGESLQVGFAASSSPHLASIIPAAPSSDLTAQAGLGNDKCETIFVLPPIKQPDGFTSSHEIATTLTAQLDAGLSRAAVTTYLDVIALHAKAAQEQRSGGTGRDHLEDATEITNSDIIIYLNIYQVDGVYYLTITAFDVSNSAGIADAMFSGETPQELSTSRLPDSFIERVQKAAVCASIEPVESVIGPNETVDLIIKITDLDSEAHEEVEVSLESKEPLCGSLEWTEQTIDSISVSNTYTANDELSCQDKLVFVGESERPQGRIKSNYNDAIARIVKPLLFHFNMKLTFYGENDGTIDFNWDADFYADEENNVKIVTRSWDPGAANGAFTGQGIHCEVHENGVLTFRSEDLKPNAVWDLELGGKMELFENGFVDVRLIPVGTSWDFDMQPFPEECTLLIENIFIWFMKSISLTPANFMPGGAIEFGGLTDEPLTMHIPLEGSSGFDVTITRAPVQARQP